MTIKKVTISHEQFSRIAMLIYELEEEIKELGKITISINIETNK